MLRIVITRVWNGIARRFNFAAAVASILLAACSAAPPRPIGPQVAVHPTLAPSFGSLRRAAGLRGLDGLAPAQVTALIGGPDLRRIDPPAEIWQYRSANCVLELYFYTDGASSKLVYAETRGRVPQIGLASRCRHRFGLLAPDRHRTRL